MEYPLTVQLFLKGSEDRGSEGELVPAHPSHPRLNVIVLNETIIIFFTQLQAEPFSCPGKWTMLVAGSVFAAEVAFGSKCNEEREDHSPQYNSYQHRPCPGSSTQSRGYG